MGERLDKWDFTRNRLGRYNPIYPWDDWTDGSIWIIRRGDDYTCEQKAMKVGLYREAAKRHLRVRMSSIMFGDQEALVFQFRRKRFNPMEGVSDRDDLEGFVKAHMDTRFNMKDEVGLADEELDG